ncbi:hypothetical protein [Kordiimonas pumila]|uniref:Uncharacterized protein n=1 Tax=Kordiimonas pumila TaxID=2161677 RepID=A0ABV7D4Z8_9PROT|nr:hypothetical protein [Kordiimonas pumila]
MALCTQCITIGYCTKRKVQLLTDKELANPYMIRDIRAYAYTLNIPYTGWHEYAVNLYRDFRGWIAGPDGKEVLLDTEVFETGNIQYWFRAFCCTPISDDITPYVRGEARERVRVLATILRANNSKAALMWGVRAANDNEKP